MGRATVEVFTARVCTQSSAMANYVTLTVLFVLLATLAAASGCPEGFHAPFPNSPRLCMHYKKLEFHITYFQAGRYCTSLKAGLPRLYSSSSFKSILKEEINKGDTTFVPKRFWLQKNGDTCAYSSYLKPRAASCGCTEDFKGINAVVCFLIKPE